MKTFENKKHTFVFLKKIPPILKIDELVDL